MVQTRTLLALIKSAILWSVTLGYPNPYPLPEPNPDGCCQPGPSCTNPCQMAMPQMPQMQQMQQTECCQPGPSCQNPCQAAAAAPQAQQITFTPVQPSGQSGCCSPPSATCDNPCQGGSTQGYAAAGFPTGFGGGYGTSSSYNTGSSYGGYYSGNYVGGYQQPAPSTSKTVYAPYPGEITFKLQQNWNPDTLLDHASPAYQILAGNVVAAVKAVLGPNTYVNNVYFREGYVPGNPSSQPKVVVHCMVNGGSDAAGILAFSVKPDGTLGDGLKVFKDSFNAY